ncbi:hypothetical protein M3Y95_00354000 [Aphelenchoides besseyi]|nr:hypothetical protein M3Y95_00354000 [Aphelenchoides besseyi]
MTSTRVLLLISLLAVGVSIGRSDVFYFQTQITCNGQPYSNASVAVYEEDKLRDDICYVTKTDANGSFIAKGVEENDGFMALSWLGGAGDKVYFYVRHNCNRDYFVCSKIELGDTIWSHSPKTVVAPTVLPAIELARIDLEECLPGVVVDMERGYTGPECVNWL